MRPAVFFVPLILFVIHPSTAPAQSFEAVSLHPLAPGVAPDGNAASAALNLNAAPDAVTPSLLSIDVTLADLIVSAYDVRDAGMQPGLLKQLPDWAQGDEFHLTARLPPGATMSQMRGMLRTLLRERFAVASHVETAPAQVLLLQVDPKQGSKLVPHAGACTQDTPCETHMKPSAGLIEVQFVGETLDEIAGELGGYAWYWGGLRYGPVVNATALQGRYDGSFTFAPLTKADVAGGPTLVDALRHDLGLTLQKSTRVLSRLRIDHLERPTFD